MTFQRGVFRILRKWSNGRDEFKFLYRKAVLLQMEWRFNNKQRISFYKFYCCYISRNVLFQTKKRYKGSYRVTLIGRQRGNGFTKDLSVDISRRKKNKSSFYPSFEGNIVSGQVQLDNLVFICIVWITF